MKWTVAEALSQAATELKPSSRSPRLDAEVLLAELLGRDRAWLLAHPEWPIPDRLVSGYARKLIGRLAGRPVAHLTGTKEFFGLPLMVTPNVLVPRPTTELLVECVRRKCEPTDNLIVDVGTGSGAIALALASLSRDWRLIATDTSIDALRLAAANSRRLGLPGRVDWRFGSLLTPVENEHLSVIVANLPYLTPEEQATSELKAEPAGALVGGVDGLAIIERLMKQATERTDWQGLVLEASSRQVRQLRTWAETAWPDAVIEELTDGLADRGLAIWRN